VCSPEGGWECHANLRLDPGYQRRQFVHSLNITIFTVPVLRGFSLCRQFMKESRFLVQVTGKFRRFYLVHFRKGYKRRQLLLRRGECRQCGTCCTLLFSCPMLTRQGLCFIYGRCRPQVCKVFPIDQRDIDEVALCGGECSYRFELKSAK